MDTTAGTPARIRRGPTLLNTLSPPSVDDWQALATKRRTCLPLRAMATSRALTRCGALLLLLRSKARQPCSVASSNRAPQSGVAQKGRSAGWNSSQNGQRRAKAPWPSKCTMW